LIAVIEVADVFRGYGTEYLQKFGERMPPSHRRVFKDILRCRTPAMGGHVFECNHCGRLQYAYHSCRNRSCPKCHKSDTQAWLQGRQKELLPVPYYHVIFTLPHELRGFTRLHQQDLITPIRPLLTDETQFVWLLKFQRTCPRFSPIEYLCRLRDTKTLNSCDFS
jgi:hypothetical protein